MPKKNYDNLFSKLLELFPNPDTELKFNTPFQLLVAVMLSAQTTDRQVNVVTDKLFLKIKEPKDVIKISEESLAKQVSSINYKVIKRMCKLTIDMFMLLYNPKETIIRS